MMPEIITQSYVIIPHMGAIILNGAVIQSGAAIGDGTVIKENTRVGPNELWAGVPGRYVKPVQST